MPGKEVNVCEVWCITKNAQAGFEQVLLKFPLYELKYYLLININHFLSDLGLFTLKLFGFIKLGVFCWFVVRFTFSPSSFTMVLKYDTWY